MNIRLVLADDHEVVRQGLGALLQEQPDLEVVGEADNGFRAVELVLELHPDVVLMDLMMPELDGISATRILHDQRPDVRVVILSSLDENSAVVAAVRAGAIGYLRKNVSIDVLARTIRAAARGQLQVSPAVAARLVREVHGSVDHREQLTKRELEVVALVARGLANKEIAWKLAISEKTVKSHVSTILAKFEVDTRTQAALYATRNGLVSADPDDAAHEVTRAERVRRPSRQPKQHRQCKCGCLVIADFGKRRTATGEPSLPAMHWVRSHPGKVAL